MPFGDGTGPMGLGPMTGRGAGYCAGYAMPGSMNPMAGTAFRYAYAGRMPMRPMAGFGYRPMMPYGGFRGRPGFGPGYGRGMGFGRGRGFGRGFGRGAWPHPYAW